MNSPQQIIKRYFIKLSLKPVKQGFSGRKEIVNISGSFYINLFLIYLFL
jgi:fluoride ion exporter CrcB/FEX